MLWHKNTEEQNPACLVGVDLPNCMSRKNSSKRCDRVITWASVRVQVTYFQLLYFSHAQEKLLSDSDFIHHHFLLYLLNSVFQCPSTVCQGSSKFHCSLLLSLLLSFFNLPVLLELSTIFPPIPHLLSVSLVIRLSLTLRVCWRRQWHSPWQD